MSEKHCCCRSCARFRKIEALMNKYKMTLKERELMDDFMMGEIALSEDLSWYKSIFDGSWPQGKQILEDVLKKHYLTDRG